MEQKKYLVISFGSYLKALTTLREAGVGVGGGEINK